MARRRSCEIHTHSTVSDGAYPPDELAELLADHGVELWALTDHDNVGGCGAAAEHARRLGIGFVPGVEISAALDGESIHVLGYGFDPETPQLADYAEQMVRFRTIGDMTCTGAVESTATTIPEVIEEVATANHSERGGRTDDQRSEAAMEDRKRKGYF